MKLVPGYEYQLTLVLDFRVALEAVLIQRLKQQPKSRQQEWLRRLLVLGFREECSSLRQAHGPTPRPAASTAAPWLAHADRANETVASAPIQRVKALDAAHHKPLAALQKVLGEKVA